MNTLIDIINAIPDDVRMLDVVFLTLRVIAAACGLTFFEDGSVS